MAEDLGEEDIVGNVLGFEFVATDGAVGAAEAAWFPWQVEGAKGGGNVLGELWAGGVDVSGAISRPDPDSRQSRGQIAM
jgi:hypothetical protein